MSINYPERTVKKDDISIKKEEKSLNDSNNEYQHLKSEYSTSLSQLKILTRKKEEAEIELQSLIESNDDLENRIKNALLLNGKLYQDLMKIKFSNLRLNSCRNQYYGSIDIDDDYNLDNMNFNWLRKDAYERSVQMSHILQDYFDVLIPEFDYHEDKHITLPESIQRCSFVLESSDVDNKMDYLDFSLSSNVKSLSLVDRMKSNENLHEDLNRIWLDVINAETTSLNLCLEFYQFILEEAKLRKNYQATMFSVLPDLKAYDKSRCMSIFNSAASFLNSLKKYDEYLKKNYVLTDFNVDSLLTRFRYTKDILRAYTEHLSNLIWIETSDLNSIKNAIQLFQKEKKIAVQELQREKTFVMNAKKKCRKLNKMDAKVTWRIVNLQKNLETKIMLGILKNDELKKNLTEVIAEKEALNDLIAELTASVNKLSKQKDNILTITTNTSKVFQFDDSNIMYANVMAQNNPSLKEAVESIWERNEKLKKNQSLSLKYSPNDLVIESELNIHYNDDALSSIHDDESNASYLNDFSYVPDKLITFPDGTVEGEMSPIEKENTYPLDLSMEDFENFINSERISNLDNETSINKNETSINKNETSINENETSINENETSINENETSINENETSINENETSINENQISVNENQISVNENQTSVNENDSRCHLVLDSGDTIDNNNCNQTDEFAQEKETSIISLTNYPSVEKQRINSYESYCIPRFTILQTYLNELCSEERSIDSSLYYRLNSKIINTTSLIGLLTFFLTGGSYIYLLCLIIFIIFSRDCFSKQKIYIKRNFCIAMSLMLNYLIQ